jgi:hypothetical protein
MTGVYVYVCTLDPSLLPRRPLTARSACSESSTTARWGRPRACTGSWPPCFPLSARFLPHGCEPILRVCRRGGAWPTSRRRRNARHGGATRPSRRAAAWRGPASPSWCWACEVRVCRQPQAGHPPAQDLRLVLCSTCGCACLRARRSLALPACRHRQDRPDQLPSRQVRLSHPHLTCYPSPIRSKAAPATVQLRTTHRTLGCPAVFLRVSAMRCSPALPSPHQWSALLG